MNFDQVSEKILPLKIELEAAEIHGLITGWLSAGAKWAGSEQNDALAHWFGADAVTSELKSLVSSLAKATLADLQDAEMTFQLLLPDDDTSIAIRQKNISHWCNGFLAGFGTSGRYQQSELVEDVAEVFRDLARIAGLDDDIPDDDENETDLMEINEYVRMTALFVFTECASKPVH